MILVRTIDELRKARTGLSGQVGLVPTMGALHAGHMSLVEMARTENDHVIATIFVNPTQFAPNEDLDSYPRDLDGDLEKFRLAGVDLVFTPAPQLMYPDSYETFVTVEKLTQRLEGESRPEHFRGVTTIVAKLFNLIQPHFAYFGQKDAQQVVVLRKMVRDLNFPLQIVVGPTVREKDGLAMSSRNAYLNEQERKAAGTLYRALWAAAVAYADGERTAAALRQAALDVLNAEILVKTDYVDVLDARTLEPAGGSADAPLIAVLAAQVGKPRLLDNCLLPWALNDRDGLTATLGKGFA